MTNITLHYRNGNIVGVQAAGHTGYAAAGADIVCASVSALVQAAANGAVKYAQAATEVKDGALTLKIATPNKESGAILETMRMGLEDMQKTYPRHIKIRSVKEHDSH